MKKYFFSLLTFLFLYFFSYTQAQVITTIAGTGSSVYSGDGGAATLAGVTVQDAQVDDAGNIYIVDAANHRIRRITAGIISTIAGVGAPGFGGDGGQATAAYLNYPNEVAVDHSGNIFIADGVNNRIRKIDASGIITTIAGTGSGGYFGDGGPATNAEIFDAYGITVDVVGNIYIADSYNNRIRKIDTSGIITTIAGNGFGAPGSGGFSGDGGPATNAELTWPSGVAVDNIGNIYIADDENNRIRKVDIAGIITTIAGSGTVGTVAGGYTGSYSGDGGPATIATLNTPTHLALDGCGNLFVSDEANNRIRRVSADGIMSTVAGDGTGGYMGDGHAATAAEIFHPGGIALGRNGNLIIADNGNVRLREVANIISLPSFTAGATHAISVCENAVADLDPALVVSDVNIGEMETWSVVLPPSHGSVAASFTATVTGSSLTPTGATYTPAPGYSGTDTFKVMAAECSGSDTIAIYVTVNPGPVVGAISGISYICYGDLKTLRDTTVGGVWGSSNRTIDTVNDSGVVFGVTPGVDTISYSITSTDFGCTATALLQVFVEICEGVKNVSGILDETMLAYPNPNQGTFTVNVSSGNDEQVRLTVTNVLGQKVKEITAETNKPTTISFDMPGIYILTAITSNGKIDKRLVIR